MEVRYYPDTDTLYIRLADRPGADADEVNPGVVIDYDADGVVIGIEIEHASRSFGYKPDTRAQIATLFQPTLTAAVRIG